jgi:hypothetical protein
MRAIRNLLFAVVVILSVHIVLPPGMTAQGGGSYGCQCGDGGCLATFLQCNESCPGLPTCAQVCNQTGCSTATSGDNIICSPGGGGCGNPPLQAFNVHVFEQCSCCLPDTWGCAADNNCCNWYCNPSSYICGDWSCYADGFGCSSASQCCGGYCNVDAGWVCGLPGSPILINLGSNSANFNLTSAVDGVAFDIDNDGILDRVGWTQPNSLLAFLVLDRNHNGTIDNGSELFGTATRKRDGTIAANGFDALLDLDGGTAASDGRIDSRDAIYSQLRLWIDRNHNGLSEPTELMTLSDAGLTAIYLDYHEDHRVDSSGNSYRLFGRALMLNRNGTETPRLVFDVYFKVLK